MSKTKLLAAAVVALFLLNLAVLGYLITTNKKTPPPPAKVERGERPPRHRDALVEQMDFSPEQMEEFSGLKAAHQLQNKSINDQIRTKYQTYYGLLKTETVDQAVADRILSEVSDLHQQLAASNFQHFQDLKALCTDEQLDQFNGLIDQLSGQFRPMQRSGPPPKGNRPPPGGPPPPEGPKPPRKN
ncbi:MAG: periplasmic heavy metal sensor [Saprospiraceae bacterium]|nr:periplasmic heavy metal sensor [Saprospiraceae bacterium]